MQFPIIQAFRNKLSNYSHSDNQSALEMRYSLIWFILSPYSQLEAIIGGNQSDTSVGEFLSRVVIATQPVTNNTTRPSDLLIAVNILLTLAEYNNASQGNISSEEDVHNLATVVSNLLDPGNTITWQNLSRWSLWSYWAVFVRRCPLTGTSLEQLACEVVSNSWDPYGSLCICCVVQGGAEIS